MGPHLTATQMPLRQMDHSASGAVGVSDALHQACRLQAQKGQRGPGLGLGSSLCLQKVVSAGLLGCISQSHVPP